MKRIRPNKTEMRLFLQSAVIDPNKPGNFFERQIVEQGDPGYFEIRTIERMAEALRIRERLKTSKGKGRQTLLEEYQLVMRQAATAIALAVGKVNETYEVKGDT